MGFDAFEEFCCPDGVHPVVFMQLCSHYHQSKLLDNPQAQVSTSSVKSNTSETSSSEAKKKVPDANSDNILGQVWVGVTHEPICIPANSVKVVQGKTNKIMRCLMCMVESRDINNLPVWGRGQQGHDYPKEIQEGSCHTRQYEQLQHLDLTTPIGR